MERQFIACRFRPTDSRTYTYHNDGDPVEVGDDVEVETKQGVKTVSVAEIVDEPSFPTKAILRKLEPESNDD